MPELGRTWMVLLRDVAFHPRNCFTKTGVTSRGELAAQLQVRWPSARVSDPRELADRDGSDSTRGKQLVSGIMQGAVKG